MDPLLIPVVALGIALGIALIAMRRRADEVDELRRAFDGRGTAIPPTPPAGHEPAPEPAAAPATLPASPTAPRVDAFEAVPVGILAFDADLRVLAANERAHALLDVAPGRLVGRSCIETFLDTRVEALIEGVAVGAAATTDLRAGAVEPRDLLLRVTRPDAETRLVVVEDVTELRRLRQIRTEFIDNLSHELRTPLSTVSLLAETLSREAELADVPPRMKDRIGKIEVETGHLVQMVNELLDLARIEGGSQLRLDDDVDLGRLAEASAERLRLFAERQGVTLVVDAAPDLPAVRGDEARLGQVLVNLVHNAVKFSPDGGEVRIEVRPVEEGTQVSVIDHGIGIPRADRARVFERFYKVDRARVRGGGTGLGLAIARHVVAGHGGRIWVDSQEGAGSTFSFVVPRHPGGEPLASQAPAAAGPT